MVTLDEILEGLFNPGNGDFSSELARYVLEMRFTEERAARYESLVEKSRTAPSHPPNAKNSKPS